MSGKSVGGSSIVTTGALNSGSITSGFGNIDTGSSTITTTGLISGGSLDIDNVLINGTTIGHTDDTDLITVADGLVTVAGEVQMTTLDIGGTNVTSTAAELNILDGVTSTAAELNILDGVTSTAAELNILDGVTSTAAELNILDGVTASAAELNFLDDLDRGSLIYGNSSGATAVLGQGTADQVLTSDGTDISWEDAGGGSTTFNTVGTYCLGYYTGLGVHNGGATFAGSGIRTANTYAGGGGTSGSSTSTLTGTWRLMGNIGYYNGGSTASNANVSGTLFLRIS